MITSKRILAAACAAAMLLTFAACNTNKDEASTTTPPTAESGLSQPVSEEAASQPETPLPSASDPANSVSAPSGGDKTTAATPQGGQQNNKAPGSSKPANTAEAVALYNSALKKVGGTKGTYSRTMDKAKATVLVSIDLMKQGVPELFDKKNETLPGAKLASLNANDVASSTVTESGDNYVITFQLKGATASSSSPLGTGGYMYYINYEEAKALVKSVGGKFNLNLNTVPEKTSIQLSGGVLKVTINKKTGKLSTAESSFTEHVDSKFNGSANGSLSIDGHGNAVYTLS